MVAVTVYYQQVADFGENTRDTGDAREPPDAEPSAGINPIEQPLEPKSDLDAPPLTEHDGSGVALRQEEQTFAEHDADAGEPSLLRAASAGGDIGRNDASAAASISASESTEASCYHRVPDVQNGDLDSQADEKRVNQFDPELLSASTPMIEAPVGNESKTFEEQPPAAIVSLAPASRPDELPIAVADESLGLNGEVRESDQEGIIGLLDESAEDGFHSMERQDEDSVSTERELSVDHTPSGEAVDSSEETSVPEISQIESVEAQQSVDGVEEAPGDVVVDELADEGVLPQEGGGNAVPSAPEEEGERLDAEQFIAADDHEGVPLDTDQSDGSDSEPLAPIEGEANVGETHIESTTDELADPEYYVHEEVTATSAPGFEYHRVADTESDESTFEMHFERNPSPGPVYDAAAEEASDHAHGYPHDPSDPISGEYSVSPENAHEAQLVSEDDPAMGVEEHRSPLEHHAHKKEEVDETLAPPATPSHALQSKDDGLSGSATPIKVGK